MDLYVHPRTVPDPIGLRFLIDITYFVMPRHGVTTLSIQRRSGVTTSLVRQFR